MSPFSEHTRPGDRLWLRIAEQPWLFASLIVLALALLPVAVWLDLKNLSDNALTTQARTFNGMFNDILGDLIDGNAFRQRPDNLARSPTPGDIMLDTLPAGGQ